MNKLANCLFSAVKGSATTGLIPSVCPAETCFVKYVKKHTEIPCDIITDSWLFATYLGLPIFTEQINNERAIKDAKERNAALNKIFLGSVVPCFDDRMFIIPKGLEALKTYNDYNRYKNNVKRLEATIDLIGENSPHLVKKVAVIYQDDIVTNERTRNDYRNILKKYPDIIMTQPELSYTSDADMKNISDKLRANNFDRDSFI